MVCILRGQGLVAIMGDRSVNISPSVSLIIPVYNGMGTLPGCLDSVEKQDYSGQLEVIIVDDGSNDGSGEYAQKRGFKVIRQNNRGPGVARNVGAEASKGELLIFTDADCILDADFVTQLTKPVISGEVVGSQGVFYSEQRNIVARFIQAEVLERYQREAAVKYIDWVATYGACYRRDVFLGEGGFNDTYSSEDAEFSFRLAEKGMKMALAPDARCKHLHYENFFKFLRYKYKRAYWTIWLYRQYPHKLMKHNLTPPARRNMMVWMICAICFLLSGLFWKPGLIAGLIFSLILLLSTLKFAVGIFESDPLVALLSPLFLLARTASYILGFSRGLCDYSRGVRGVKRSAKK